jgi:osmotically-inducible protein OsmY
MTTPDPILNDELLRGDEPIRDEVLDALSEIAEVRDDLVDVEVEEGEVTLTGTVPDRKTQLAAEEAARGVRGVTDVESELSIDDSAV